MRRRILRTLVTLCTALGLLALPTGLTSTAHAATSEDVVRNEEGHFLAKAEFNSGLHYYHENGKPGPGVNSFQVLDRCGDGLIPKVTWTQGTTTRVATLTDECLLPGFPFRSHTVKTGYAPEVMEKTTWYVSLVDANGELKYAGDAFLEDWLGSYSHDTESEFFVHSSVYRDEFGDTGRDTVIASLVPTTEAYGRVGSVNEVWDELLERTPLPPGITADQNESMLKQLACHLLYAIPGKTGGPTWDLEAEHPNIPWEEVLDPVEVRNHECNWGFIGDRLPTIPPVNGDPDDAAPMVHAGRDVSGNEGSEVRLDGAASDDSGRPATEWSYTVGDDVDAGTTCAFTDKTSVDTAFTCTDDGTFTVTLTADDGVNRPVSDSARVTVRNVAPALTLKGPENWSVHRVGGEVGVRATFTDPGSNDTHTCKVTWDDGQVSTFDAKDGVCDAGHGFGRAGMNTIKVAVADDDGGSDAEETMVVVYDPRAGLLTGLGSVDGSAFTVASKYASASSTVPAGAVVLDVPTHDGRLKVVSTKLEWLVITPDGKAAVKGESVDHGFLGYAQAGKFRGVVWPLSAGDVPPENPLYDTSPGASWDLDRAQPKAVTAGAMVIDSGWIPGLPKLPGTGGLLDDLLPRTGLELGH
ncbi:hypothetical protein ACM01_46260 [Streptomyces viridochromogenes]|uniref:PKD domain-containing protein n=1 Tax=Streptomyces viridochromogenes TaxID=1938 RepID=A0A0J7YRT3_STRVR|nr:DUF2599 domain-containing protein [Streptomyces viridochromogenes]KMS66184.1 hypothetical protein ACM01_46260 [Streptomyces viridochromogenes]KOG08148.1 hypothetical protein ADK35_42275 [Streptomyces viridochromogenes]KOG09780.1 hypothetical protein ADK36_40075 [Streptomyces viridochromogenes]